MKERGKGWSHNIPFMLSVTKDQVDPTLKLPPSPNNTMGGVGVGGGMAGALPMSSGSSRSKLPVSHLINSLEKKHYMASSPNTTVDSLKHLL